MNSVSSQRARQMALMIKTSEAAFNTQIVGYLPHMLFSLLYSNDAHASVLLFTETESRAVYRVLSSLLVDSYTYSALP